MMENCPLAKEWHLYRDRVLAHIVTDPAMIEHIRWVFYAGAASFYSLMLESKNPPAIMADLTRELLEFAEYIRQQGGKPCCSRSEAESK